MRALILAAGRGSRMGENTARKPKCLNEIMGRPLLHWQLDALKTGGIRDITVVRGYRFEMLQGDFSTVNNDRWSETNMVGSLFCAPSSDDDTLISYSDIAYRNEHIKQLMEANGDIIITADKAWHTLWSVRFEDPLDDAETFKTDKDNNLIAIGNKTDDLADIEAQYMGLIKLSQKGWDNLKGVYDTFSAEKQDKMDMTSMLNEMLVRGHKIHVEYIDGGWCEADSYEDILAYEAEIEKNPNWSHDWRK